MNKDYLIEAVVAQINFFALWDKFSRRCIVGVL